MLQSIGLATHWGGVIGQLLQQLAKPPQEPCQRLLCAVAQIVQVRDCEDLQPALQFIEHAASF